MNYTAGARTPIQEAERDLYAFDVSGVLQQPLADDERDGVAVAREHIAGLRIAMAELTPVAGSA